MQFKALQLVETCYVVDKGSKIAFCKNIIRLVLCVGRKKFRAIATNYWTTTPKSHGTTGKHNNDINEDTLRDEIESFIKLIAEEQDKSMHIRDTELDTIELLSHYTKWHLHCVCC